MANHAARFASAIVTALALAGVTSPAFAADHGGGGGGGDGGGGGGGPAADLCRVGLVRDPVTQLCVPCKPGTVYDADKKACLDRGAKLLDDHRLYE